MKNRIKDKQRKRLLMLIVWAFREFKPTKVNFSNGYKEKNLEVNFSLKTIQDWRIGVKIAEGDNVWIFADHEVLVDKFKPSAVEFSVCTTLSKLQEEFLIRLKELQKDPYREFAISRYFSDIPKEVTDYKQDYEEFMAERREYHWEQVEKYHELLKAVNELKEAGEVFSYKTECRRLDEYNTDQKLKLLIPSNYDDDKLLELERKLLDVYFCDIEFYEKAE